MGSGGRPGLETTTRSEKNLKQDLPSSVLILPMGNRVDDRLTQGFHRVLVDSHAVEPDHSHGMTRIAIDEGEGAIDRDGHRCAEVFVVSRRAVRLCPAIGVGQDPTLGEDGRWIRSQEHDASRGGKVFVCGRVMPDESAHLGAGEEVLFRETRTIAPFGGGQQSPGDLVIEVLPADTIEEARLERRRGLDRLVGDRFLIAGGSDAEAVTQQLHQSSADLSLELDDVVESLVLEAVRVELGKQGDRSLVALDLPRTANEGEHGEGLFFRAAVLGVGDGQMSNWRAIRRAHDQQVDLTGVQGFDAAFQRLCRGGGFVLVEHRRAVRRQKVIRDHQVLNDEPFILELFLHGADEHAELRHHRGASARSSSSAKS